MSYTFKTEADCYWPEIDVIASVTVTNEQTHKEVCCQELTLPWRVAKELGEKLIECASKAEKNEQEYVESVPTLDEVRKVTANIK